MKSFLLFGITILLTGSAFAASKETAQEYLNKSLENTDMQELSQVTAKETITAFSQSGITFSEDNATQATNILTNSFNELLPKTIMETLPIVMEIYTDEELAAAMEFMSTDLGGTFMSKGGLYGAKSSTQTQEVMMPALMAVMPQIMELAN